MNLPSLQSANQGKELGNLWKMYDGQCDMENMGNGEWPTCAKASVGWSWLAVTPTKWYGISLRSTGRLLL